jgi:alginate O-acetyltransferase complex protein AlgI
VIFGTYWFVAFCCVFYPGYWLFSFSKRFRQAWLLLACFIFHYHFAGPAGVFPIIILSLLTFGAALSRRGPLIVFAIGINVFALCFYKYFHFLCLHVLGLANPQWGDLLDRSGGVLLPGAPPLAISFFIFELVHYLYDVRSGNLPLKNIANYASFIFYFPSLVAGPIKRYENFMPQLDRGLGAVSPPQVMAGLLRIARGYFMKIVLADFLTGFVGYYEPGFDSLTQLMRWSVFLALGLRIWFDFSGYSEIAIGLALMMGIELPENFNWPYAALNIRDFWHRWHISLSSWIRDYVYIPLGGNRVGFPRKILNGIIAFALCGLWHGPAWHFVVWGLYHGVGLAVSSNYRAIFGKIGERVHYFLETNPAMSWLITFLFVMVGWVFFFYPVHQAVHLLYLLVFKLHFVVVALTCVVIVCAFFLGKRPPLWNGLGQLRPSLRSKAELLQPSFLFIGVLLGFSICCLAGRYPQTHPIYKDFLRFHQAINPESAFYPTASQVRTLADATLPKDKIIVIIGGNSVFLGLKQNADEVWTFELQKLLGDRFAVLNLGMPNGTATGISAVTFEMLAKSHPRSIYAFSQIPLGLIPADGGDTYRYFFWDAYYKGLIDFSPDRLRLVQENRGSELRTPDGQEMHIGAFLDSYVNADDLWTWVGYRWLWTVWSDKTAATPFKPRRLYQDEHDNPEFPPTNPYLNPLAEKPANHQYRDMVLIHGDAIIADPLAWTPCMDTEANVVPADLRGRTIACLHWFNPWTSFALNKDDLAAQDFCYESAYQTFLADGYHSMEFGKNYPGEEYADGTHLNATGGRHLARQLAPLILEIAKSQHDLDSDP